MGQRDCVARNGPANPNHNPNPNPKNRNGKTPPDAEVRCTYFKDLIANQKEAQGCAVTLPCRCFGPLSG